MMKKKKVERSDDLKTVTVMLLVFKNTNPDSVCLNRCFFPAASAHCFDTNECRGVIENVESSCFYGGFFSNKSSRG